MINDWKNCSIKELPYKRNRQILCIENGILLKGTVPVIPEVLRNQVMQSAHSTHSGVMATNLLRKKEAWWPQFTSDVENMIRQCPVCCETKPKKQDALDKWPEEDGAWKRVHMDHAIISHFGIV